MEDAEGTEDTEAAPERTQISTATNRVDILFL
jgi:hypothetical protein